MTQSKQQEVVRKFPRAEIIHAMPDAAKRLCDYLRNFVPTTATDSLGQSDFGKKLVGNDVIAELDRFTYLFYGRTADDYERDHAEAVKRWLYPVEGWIVATPTPIEREELAKHGDSIRVMHSTYAGWSNQVTRCVDSLFWGMATLRIYFHRGVVFHNDQWIKGGEWLFDRWVNHTTPPLSRVPWFDSDWCRAPMYGSWPPEPYQSSIMQTTSPPVPDTIRQFGLFEQQKTDGLPIEWVESIERYAELLGVALSVDATAEQSKTQGTAKGRKAARAGRKKADYETVERESELAVKWSEARGSGTYKADFARDNGFSQVELDKLLGRVSKRNRRSDK